MLSIIGGSGFIGTRLCRRLINNKNECFVIVDKAQSALYPKKVLIADVRNADELRGAIVENSVIINLAAEHRDDVRTKSLYDEVNVNGARNICLIAREKNIKKIIFTSSVAIYGFAPIGTDEKSGANPFNDYGRTKYEAENIFTNWQNEAPNDRTLVIVRPTVVFGEQNRGNVYNLFNQIASGRFLMVGDGKNKKSMAYVENLAAFIEFTIGFKPGVHIYNYIDKPDISMNHLVQLVNKVLGKSNSFKFRLPLFIGLLIGYIFDLLAYASKKKFSISSIRVKKFCSNSVFNSAVIMTGFKAEVALSDAIEKTVKYEFKDNNQSDHVYYSE